MPSLGSFNKYWLLILADFFSPPNSGASDFQFVISTLVSLIVIDSLLLCAGQFNPESRKKLSL